MSKALVISGGGSKGAFAGGVAEYLMKVQKNEYDLFVGSSAGALLVNHLALGKMNEIKEIVCSTTQKDVFTICPFSIKELDDVNFKVSVNHWNTLKTFLLRRQSFGDSQNLRKMIRKNLSRKDYATLIERNKQVVVSVSNLTKFRTEYKSNLDYSYNDFTDWVWASANYVPFMSVLNKYGNEYADGGFGSHTPIQAAIDLGAKDIDVIILEPEIITRDFNRTTNPFGSLMRVFGFMTEQIYYNDLMIARLHSSNKQITIRYFHTPNLLTDFPFVFKPSLLSKWWQNGYDYAKDQFEVVAKPVEQ
jgi:NTE family protein